MAIVANQEFRGREILRSLLVIPWATPWIVVGFLWGYILSGEFGLINGILRTLGIIHENIIFLSPEGAIFWTAVAAAWTQSSFTALLVLSGLQSIPDSLYEASEIDGAGIFQRFRHITLPWIQPIFNLCVLLNAMVGLTIFDIVFIMTRGGPGDRTLTLSILAYRTFFLGLDIGGGAAVSILLALLVLLVGIAYLTIFYRRMEFYR
jgi:multiple sugar transport system permease protein